MIFREDKFVKLRYPYNLEGAKQGYPYNLKGTRPTYPHNLKGTKSRNEFNKIVKEGSR